MAFFTLLRHVIHQKRALTISISEYCNCAKKTRGGSKYMSTSTPRLISPGLMLPPDSEGVYKYYSLAEKRVVSIPGGGGQLSESELVGSSHGWLALLNRRNNDLSLSNPLSGEHIRLPRVEILRDAEDEPSVSVLKVILSSSPEEEGCRAIMTYAAMRGESRMAFCLPGRSWRWTWFGCFSSYEDLVCGRRFLTTITAIEFDSEFGEKRGGDLESWDIGKAVIEDWNMGEPEAEFRDSAGPPSALWEEDEEVNPLKDWGNKSWILGNRQMRRWMKEQEQEQCLQIPHLVYGNEEQLYLVSRYVANTDTNTNTVGFVVMKVKRRTGVYEVVEDLNGMAMFVGTNHSFAVSSADYTDLTPNSIYFTHAKRRLVNDAIPRCFSDTGIFDYQNKTITPIDLTDDDDEAMSSPIWFNFTHS